MSPREVSSSTDIIWVLFDEDSSGPEDEDSSAWKQYLLREQEQRE